MESVLINRYLQILELESRNPLSARRGRGFGLVLPSAGPADAKAEGFSMSARELEAYVP
jgi:hypothetical protein